MWYQIPGTDVYLIDTPGFDDTYKDDLTILRSIAQILEDFFGESVKVRGVVYIHAITEPRMKRSSLRNLRLFEKIIGPNNMKSCYLVTTKWSLQPEEKSIANENQLKSNKDFWGLMCSRGAKVKRFRDTNKSARNIWEPLAEQSSFTSQITEEYTRQARSLPSTTAGREVSETLEETKKAHMEEVMQLKAEAQRAREHHDREIEALADSERRKLEAELRKMQEDQRVLAEEREMERRHFEEQVASMGKEFQKSVVSTLEADREERKACAVRRRNRRGRWIARGTGLLFALSLPVTGPLTLAGPLLMLGGVEAGCQLQKSSEEDDYGARGF
jgi:hypothetical protein